MDRYCCSVCGWVYDEAAGLPDRGVPAGTRWEDLPSDFECPECIASKDAFEKRVPSRVYVCSMCGFRFEESKGSAKAGIPAGTLWEDVPESFRCPLCGCVKNIIREYRDERLRR